MNHEPRQIYQPRKKYHKIQPPPINHTIPDHFSEIDFREEVKLQPGQNREDWIAKHTSAIFKEMSLLFSNMHEFCTDETCPKMTAGRGYVYCWRETIPDRGEALTLDVSAPNYITLLLSWMQDNIANSDIFPVSQIANYPEHFHDIVKSIMNRAFRFYAHVYYHHLPQLQAIGLSLTFHSSFRHFVFFVYEFDLIDIQQVDPLRDTIQRILDEK